MQPAAEAEAKQHRGGTAEFNFWGLNLLVNVAKVRVPELASTTLTEIGLAKDFWNLIHPGRAARLGIKCDRGTALISFVATPTIWRGTCSRRHGWIRS